MARGKGRASQKLGQKSVSFPKAGNGAARPVGHF